MDPFQNRTSIQEKRTTEGSDMMETKIETSEALVEEVVLPCLFMEACDSPSRNPSWACSGFVKNDDRLQSCVFFNRFQNLELKKPEDLRGHEWIRLLKRQIRANQVREKRNRGKDRR